MIETVGIVGGGLMGCLAALGFARRGKRVTLFERAPALMTGASRGNEGKVHRGFTYGLDRTGATGLTLLRYGLTFESALRTALGRGVEDLFLHRRQYYAVHRDSSLPDDGVAGHMGALRDALARRGEPAAVRRLDRRERQALFADAIRDVWEVREESIDCNRLVDAVRAAVAAAPGIVVHHGATVACINHEPRARIIGTDGADLGSFDVVVNAAWEDMPRLERGSQGSLPEFCLRAKAGFVAVATGLPAMPVTITYGSFGDIVPHRDGRAYLSWYPSCLMGFTTAMDGAAAWYADRVRRFDFDAAYTRARAAFEALIPGLRFAAIPDERRFGPILAVAQSDIPDPQSRLHQRTLFGFHRRGAVIAVDTGKLTCAPRLAEELVELVCD